MNTNIPMNQQNMPVSPDELVTLGEQIYFEKKDELVANHLGEWAVIEVETKEIIINADKLTAIQEAKEKFPDKLFYIVQIGNLKPQPDSEINEIRKYGWLF